FNNNSARQVLIPNEYLLEKLLEKIKEGLIIPTHSPEFNFKYFTVLKDFSNNAQSICDKLISNDVLVTKLNLSKEIVKSSIPFIVAYEFYQILYKLTNKEILATSLEATGLLLIYNKLISEPS